VRNCGLFRIFHDNRSGRRGILDAETDTETNPF